MEVREEVLNIGVLEKFKILENLGHFLCMTSMVTWRPCVKRHGTSEVDFHDGNRWW
jgi:hypothetical protein